MVLVFASHEGSPAQEEKLIELTAFQFDSAEGTFRVEFADLLVRKQREVCEPVVGILLKRSSLCCLRVLAHLKTNKDQRSDYRQRAGGVRNSVCELLGHGQ